MPAHMRVLPKPKKGAATAARRSRKRAADRVLSKNAATVRERDGHRCRVCGSTNELHVHHIRYRSQGGEHKAEATGKAPKGHVSMAQQQIDAIQVGDQVPVRFEGTTLPTVMATVTAIDGKILRIQYDAGAPIFAGLRGMIRLPGWTKG